MIQNHKGSFCPQGMVKVGNSPLFHTIPIKLVKRTFSFLYFIRRKYDLALSYQSFS